MSQNVLIIGGTGFCGVHLVQPAVAAGYGVRVMSRRGMVGLGPWHRRMLADAELVAGDMSNPFDLSNAMEGIDLVILAASASKSRNSDQAMEYDIDVNLKGAVAVMRAAAAAGVKRVVYLSTAGAIYGPGQDVPYRETHPCQPISSYGIVKQAAEHYVRHIGEAAGIATVTARLSNPFGPGQTGLDGQGVMAVFYRMIRSDRPIRILGQGDTQRDYISVAEAMRAVWQLSIGSESGVFNIASGRSCSVLEIVETFESILGRPVQRDFVDTSKAADLGRIRIDNSKMVMTLGWRPSQDIEPPLREQIAWLEEQENATT